MAERLNNDFQFLDVARQIQRKRSELSAKQNLWKSINRLQLKLQKTKHTAA